MYRPLGKFIVGMGIIAFGLMSPTFGLHEIASVNTAGALADTPDTAEKEAFEAAKELGTVDAWNAFLANYATGFHADLARAYLKKLGASAAAAASTPDDFPVVAGSWGGIVRDGPGQNYRKIDSLDEGQAVTLMGRTDVVENGFPWFKIAYGEDGRGYQWGGILCSANAERPDLFKTCPPASATVPAKTPRPVVQTACAAGRVMLDGKCIERGAAASYCGPGYRPQGGKCVHGYKAPNPSVPLSNQQKKAVKIGCPKGQVWSTQEGCHEDD